MMIEILHLLFVLSLNTALKIVIMRKFSYLLFVTLIASGLFMQSCTKDKDAHKTSEIEIQFTVEQSDPDYKDYDSVPECIDGEMHHVQFFITKYVDNGDGTVTETTQGYNSNILFIEGENLTKAIKLRVEDDVTYKLTKFLVFRADDVLMKVAPLPGSLYHELMENKLDLPLNIQPFKKLQITIDVVCYEECCGDGFNPPPGFSEETAFALGTHTFNYYDAANPAGLPNLDLQGNRWGWAIKTTADLPYDHNYQFWAAAGQNNINNGVLVGNVNVVYDGTNVTVTYALFPPYIMSASHVYIGDGVPDKSAPGQLGHTTEYNSNVTGDVITVSITDTNSDGIWIIAHADVWGPSF